MSAAMTEPKLTPDMVEAIKAFATQHHAIPQNVLRRMVFGYIARFSALPEAPKGDNVVNLHGGSE